jgi:hypothetical protein
MVLDSAALKNLVLSYFMHKMSHFQERNAIKTRSDINSGNC